MRVQRSTVHLPTVFQKTVKTVKNREKRSVIGRQTDEKRCENGAEERKPLVRGHRNQLLGVNGFARTLAQAKAGPSSPRRILNF